MDGIHDIITQKWKMTNFLPNPYFNQGPLQPKASYTDCFNLTYMPLPLPTSSISIEGKQWKEQSETFACHCPGTKFDPNTTITIKIKC